MAVNVLVSDCRGSAAASTSGRRYVDVDVANLEIRLSPVFEYLLSFNLSYGEVDCPVKAGQEEKLRDLLSSTVEVALETARGGFLDAHTLVLDALLFAWVQSTRIAVPCDPFLARGKWRLSTDMFVSLVKNAGLEDNLRQKLRNVPKDAFTRLAAELQEYDILRNSHDSARASTKRGLQDEADKILCASTVSTYYLRGESWSKCKQSVSQWERLNGSSLSAIDVASAIDIACRAVNNRLPSGRLTGSMLLCSSRFYACRNAVRLEDFSHAIVERELIAILNRITGDTWLGNEEGHTKRSSVGEKDIFLAAELFNPVLTAPRMTLSRLIQIAMKHSSQAPFLLSAFSIQPGLARMRIEPTEPPFMLTLLARVLRKPLSEFGGFNQLLGIRQFAVALFQRKYVHDSSGVRDADPDNFGQRLTNARRSHLDPREGLLMTVLPVLSNATFCQSNDSRREARGSGSGSEGEFRALEILYSLLVGHECELAVLDDLCLSSDGLKLFKATFPGGILLTLASYVDSTRGGDMMGFPPSGTGGLRKVASMRAAQDRARDLATSLLRSCVKALREAPPFTHQRFSVIDGASSLLMSLAIADAAAATLLTWHTRLLLEPVMSDVRKLYPEPRRTSPSAPRFEEQGFASANGSCGIVTRLAVVFGDLIRLCSTRAFSSADILNQLRGEGERNYAAGDGIEMLRNADSPSSLRSALLMACIWTLPGCTMKEFGVVIWEFLPGVLSFVRTRSNNSKVPPADVLALAPQIVVDFLTRVLLTCLSNLDARLPVTAGREELERIQMLSRQLATAINVSEMRHKALGISASTFYLKCVAAVLTRVEGMHFLRQTKQIIISTVLDQVGKLSTVSGLTAFDILRSHGLGSMLNAQSRSSGL